MQFCHCLTSLEAFIRLHPLEPQKALYYFLTCEIVLPKTRTHTLLCKTCGISLHLLWETTLFKILTNSKADTSKSCLKNAYFKWALICNPGLVLSMHLIYRQLSCCSTHIAGNLLEEVLEMRIHITLTHLLLWEERHMKLNAIANSAPHLQICDTLIWENIWKVC